MLTTPIWTVVSRTCTSPVPNEPPPTSARTPSRAAIEKATMVTPAIARRMGSVPEEGPEMVMVQMFPTP